VPITWRPSEKSGFVILARAPWWVSLLIAIGAFVFARLFVPDLYAIFVPLPFYATGGYSAWRQLRAPSAARIARTLAALRTMSAEEFTAALCEAYRREGCQVARLDDQHADLVLSQRGRTTLVAYRRWKAQRTGIEPLRALEAARRARDAHECVYVAGGEITGTARTFAADQAIRLVDDKALAAKLVRVVATRSRRARRDEPWQRGSN